MLAFVCGGCVSGATAPEEEWNRTFGGYSWDQGRSVQQTTDGGYILAGFTASFGYCNGTLDAWLIKVAMNGTEEWNRTFGGYNHDYGNSVQQTSDGGYILAGETASFGVGGWFPNDVWLVKTAANGTEVWNRTYGGSSDDGGNSVQQTTDGGYIITGYTASFVAGSASVWLLKVAPNGTEEWNSTFGGYDRDVGHSVQQTTDGGYIVAGETESFGAGSADLWLLKVAPNGTEEWNSTFGGYDRDVGHAVQQTTDGGYIVAGETASFGAGSADLWLLKVAPNGTEVWNSTFGGSFDDGGYSVQQTTDGGYIITGYTSSVSAVDVWLIKTAANGMEEWNRTFGVSTEAVGFSVQQTTDGGYIVAGVTSSFADGGDVWLIKVKGEQAELPVHNLNTSEDFATIQRAIDDADTLDGHTILVDSGIYQERVNVTKQLILRGIDTGTGNPVVDAGGIGSAITLAHDGIGLDGFTAINASGAGRAGIVLCSNNNSVINCTTAHNDFAGIKLNSSCNNTLAGNTANANSAFGIVLYSSSNNTLTGNTVSNSEGGISLYSCNNNTLTGNTVSNSGWSIELISSSENTLTNNVASNNYYGMYLSSASTNMLTGNNVSNNNFGIGLYSSSNDNHIYNNYFDNAINAYDDGNNTWNISKTAGTNIIGGLNLGGNYWCDYAGEDTNGDGLGDTPYTIPGGTNKDYLPLAAAPRIFDTGEGSYPSISGTFNGTIAPSRNLTVSTLYTYSCPGTGGHTEYAAISYVNGTVIAEAHWNGYVGDWHNLTFNNSFTLYANETYNYTIRTGSYPQIIHAESKDVTGGRITCAEFVDVNSKRHENGWIPAIKLY